MQLIKEKLLQVSIRSFIIKKGIKAKNGVVLAVEKKLSSVLIDETSF